MNPYLLAAIIFFSGYLGMLSGIAFTYYLKKRIDYIKENYPELEDQDFDYEDFNCEDENTAIE